MKIRDFLTYEPDTGILRWKIQRSGGIKPGDIAGTKEKQGYWVVKINGRIYKAHRLAWVLHYGVWPCCDIDHINRIRTDNRISNLRLATRSENCINGPVRKKSQSGAKGVTWMKSSGKWRADIRRNYKLKYLGLFNTVEEASAAYEKAAKEYENV